MRWSGRPLILVAIVVALLSVLAADAIRRFSVDTSMEHFLPGHGERRLYRVSRQVIDSTLTGRMVLTVGLRDAEMSRQERRTKLKLVAKELGAKLGKLPGFDNITQGPPKGLDQAFYDIYFPRRFAFASLDPERETQELLSDSALSARARRLKEQLAGPQSMFVRRLAPTDPWLFFLGFLEEAEQSALRLDIYEGQFFAPVASDEGGTSEGTSGGPSTAGVQKDEDFAVLFAELRDSALDSSAQGPVLEGLGQAVDDLRSRHGASLIVEASGANRFAVSTEASMKDDIERVFTLSSLGLLLLFVAFFRSFRRVAFLLLPILSGLVCALWLSLVVYGKIHALTLAFGGALIGIAIDYPVHVICHHDLSNDGDTGTESLKRIRPTLALAAGTTLVGLVGLAWASFPGIREIALFSGVGVLAALATTLLTSGILPTEKRTSGLSVAVANALTRGLEALQARRSLPWALLALAGALTLIGVTTARFAPGLDSLAPLDQDLLDEDARVQARIGQIDGGKLAIALAPSLEEALQMNEEVARTLRQAQDEGELDGFTSAATLLRSQALQDRAQRAMQTSPLLAKRTRAALEAQGFVAAGFGELEAELARRPAPLTYEILKKSPLAPLIEPLIFKAGDDLAVITPLSGVNDEAALSARLDALGGAQFFSQRTLLNQAYSDLRARTTELLLLGLLLVFCAAWARYRNLRRAVSALLPSVLAAGSTVGLLSLAGVELNLLHLLGLLLVCSMGVDYGVFLVDAQPGHVGPALLSISVGCLSTMLSFGALSLSSAPALAALGSSIGLGIVLSLVIAPTAFLLLSPAPPTS